MEKFSKNPRERMEQIYLAAEQAGLVRESQEYEKSPTDRYPYWHCQTSKRRFRLLEEIDVLEVGSDDFDRWANSGMLEIKMPKYLDIFQELIESMKTYQPPKPNQARYSRKSKNK